MGKATYLLVGTSKGLLEFIYEAGKWTTQRVHFAGMPVSVVFTDPRNGAWWVCLAHRHWGQKLHRSFDLGQSWEQLPSPQYPRDALRQPGKPASLKKIWCLQQAGPDKPDGLWMGTEPGGLFYSNDYGEHFELVESLWNHPSRMDENQWFGAGRDFPFIHSIEIDPRDSNHVYIAVSCAGVFETTDAGKSWHPRNQGLIAAYLPNPKVEVGHDPHRLLLCESRPEVLWQQNHCGIFRSTNGGASWDNVTDPNGLPDYGFALAIDHQNPMRAWVIPAQSDTMRIPPDLALCVCMTEDGGAHWIPLREGLPQKFCFDIVFRHAMDMDQERIVFGTTTGNLFLSENYGQSWSCISSHLARIDAVCFQKTVK